MAPSEPEVIDVSLDTKQQHLEELLQESEERFRLIADATPVMIWMADSAQRCDYFNCVCLEFTGCSLEQLLGHGWTQAIHPEDQQQHQTIYANAFNAHEKFQIEYRLRRANGEYRYVLETGVPRFTSKGNFVGYIGSCVDISDRKQVEEKLGQKTAQQLELRCGIEQLQKEIAYCIQRQEALAKQQQQQQVILDAVPAMIWLKDTKNRFLQVNQAVVKGTSLPVEEIEGKLAEEVYPDEAAKYYQDDLEVINSGLPKRGIIEVLKTATGEKRWVQTDKIPWRDDDGKIAGVVVFAVDVTEHQLAQMLLKESLSRFELVATASQAGLWDAWIVADDPSNPNNPVYYSPRFKQLLGYQDHEFENTLGSWVSKIHPDDRDRVLCALAAHLRKKVPYQDIEYRLLTKHREYRWFSADGQATWDKAGNPIRIAGSLRDITKRKQAEAALQESEERFRAIIAQAAVGINLTEIKGSWLLVNQKFCDLVGYTQEEMLSKTFQEITHPDELEVNLEYSRQLLAGEIQTYSIEKRYLHKDGSHVWANVTVSLVRSLEGEPMYMIGIVQDIRDRIALEKELALRQARFDAFFTTAPVGLEIIDDQLRFAHINETLAEIDGCSVAEHLGKTISEIVPEMASDLEAMCTHILTTGESILNIEETGETPKAPGVLRHWMSSRFPLLAEGGKPIAVGGVCIEITERKRTEEALKASEAQLRLALNAAQMGVWDWNIKTGRITFSEREESIFGFAPGEFDSSYETFFNSIYPDDRSYITEADRRTIEEGADYDIDYRIIWPNKTVRWIREKGTVLRDETGKAVRMIGISIDITERKQDEESLRQSEERYRKLAQQKDLLYRIANQIRNSLNLDTILETAVTEIRSLLKIERCLFMWYRAQGESGIWEIVHEAKQADLPSLLGCYPVESPKLLVQAVSNLEFRPVDEGQNLQDPAIGQFFRSLGYNCVLNLPIQTLSGQVGAVACVNGNSLGSWNIEEVELLCAVCDQLAIAINQAELYAQSRTAASIATDKATQLERALHSLQQTQIQLIQTEKMSSLGLLVAGIAHEINNPVSFIYGNVNYASDYIKDLLNLLELYRVTYPRPVPEIQALAQSIDLDFLVEDLPKVLFSMKVGANRIRDLVLSLRNFSRLDEAEKKPVSLHEGIDNTLLILKHRLKQKAAHPSIQVIKEYGQLPLANCYPSQLNQVFMNLFTNAIDALEESIVSGQWSAVSENTTDQQPRIWIRTEVNNSGYITIRIVDNGPGMTQTVLSRLFDPFFTTKPMGKGTGLGLSISYQIVVEKHKGTLHCYSELGKGAEFVVTLPPS